MNEISKLENLLKTLEGAKVQLRELQRIKFALQYIEVGKHLDRAIGWTEARLEDIKALNRASNNTKENKDDYKH